MTPHYSDAWLDIHQGDVRDVLPTLPADSVDCIVTSPPYWGLRDYGTAAWSGGDAECDHLRQSEKSRASSGLNGTATTQGGTMAWGHTCGKCGALRQDSQLGLEHTPEEYVANLVAVFRELRRVLKPSGTCWLNLGDSYAANGQPGQSNLDVLGEQYRGGGHKRSEVEKPTKRVPAGLKPKDLVGIPWRVAFALQADGWYLRSDIIWAKPNPMPESVTDRPTKSHEYLFLLTKSARYYFDADAVREANATVGDKREGNGRHEYSGKWDGSGDEQQAFVTINPAGRNLRSVWTIATRPYPGAHFAVFPPELPERCIKAGSSERGVCPECGEPWERVVERLGYGESKADRGEFASARASLGSPQKLGNGASRREVETTGWRPTCDHDAAPVPAVILDPFAGSGTVGMVANRLSRRAILIDLNADYLKQQLKRNAQTPLGLAT